MAAVMFQTLFHYMPPNSGLYIMFGMILWEGCLTGMCYINTYSRISDEVGTHTILVNIRFLGICHSSIDFCIHSHELPLAPTHPTHSDAYAHSRALPCTPTHICAHSCIWMCSLLHTPAHVPAHSRTCCTLIDGRMTKADLLY